MGKKKVKVKRKLKIAAVLLLLLIVAVFIFVIKSMLGIKIKNIYVLNNNYLSDEYIINQAELSNYPSFFGTMSGKIRKRLLDSPYIKDAKVTKKFFGVINIRVEENLPLFFKDYDKQYVLMDKTEIDSIPYYISVPKLINYIPDTVYPDFVNYFSKVNEKVRTKISEIKYDPSEYDSGRFLFYMVDGNYVYVTLVKMDSIDYYNEIYATLEDRKGILYLDSGNHFKEF